MIGTYLHAFFADQKVAIILLLVALDFLLGVLDSVRARTFRLSYIADFLRSDVTLKILGYFILYAGDKASHSAGIVGPVDTGWFAAAAFGAITLSLGGSILNSFQGLFPGVGLPPAVAGDEPAPGDG